MSERDIIMFLENININGFEILSDIVKNKILKLNG